MTYYIETDFPIEKINPLAQREANAKRPIYMLHKWWARRLGCVFRTIVLASLIPTEEWQRLDEKARRQGADAWTWLYYRTCHLGSHGSHDGHGCAEELIAKYVKDKIVLDPFMGGGTTVVEALRLGCRVIGVDVNPVAWFIVKKSVEPVDLKALDAAFKHLEETVAPDILKYYRTPCPLGSTSSAGAETEQAEAELLHTRSLEYGSSASAPLSPASGHLADVMYVFWVKTVQCASCGRKTRLFNNFRLATRNGKDYVVCPNCYLVKDVEAGSKHVVCADCGHSFDPGKGYSSGGQFTCEHCGHADKLVDWVRRTGKAPGYEMFAIEYWCPTCSVRGYKGAEDYDRNLYRQACREFERVKDTLPLPEGEIPAEGRSDPRPISFGMRRWTDLFNPRQLLCLGRLMAAIRQIEDRAVRELMVVTLSDVADSNNMLCQYHHPGRVARMFARHAYWPVDQPVENNLWGTELGAGTMRAWLQKTRSAIEWVVSPDEVTEEGKMQLRDSPLSQVSSDFSALSSKSSITRYRGFLATRSSEDMSFIPPRSVDVIVTDPPYYGNVQYAELSDFFFTWLRLGLSSDYPEFVPSIVPKDSELVVNERAFVAGQKKDDRFFRQGLLRVFTECQRVLKDEGVVAFTFHHEKAKAWAAVLESVLEAGFHVQSVWTYHSETRGGTHATGIRFDTIIVCRKRLREAEPAAWGALQDEIVGAVQGELKRLLSNGAALSTEDVFVITMGKALSVYSRHYPHILRGGKPVKLSDAIGDIESLVDEQIDAYFGMVVPPWLDTVGRVYLQHCAPRPAVTRDSLVKVCRTRNLDYSDLEQAHLIARGKAGSYEVLSPQKRKQWLDQRLEDGDTLSAIDRVHYLYAEYRAGRPIRGLVPQLYASRLEEMSDALYRITRDRAYAVVTQTIIQAEEQGVLLG